MSTQQITERYGFTVLQNNGRDNNFVNTCLFISIKHLLECMALKFLEASKNTHQLSISELRDIANFSGSNNEIWDKDKPSHVACLQNLCKKLDIQICILYANFDQATKSYWIGPFKDHIYGSFVPTYRRGSIAAYGNHFEAIISKTSFSDEFSLIPVHLQASIKIYSFGQNDTQSKPSEPIEDTTVFFRGAVPKPIPPVRNVDLSRCNLAKLCILCNKTVSKPQTEQNPNSVALSTDIAKLPDKTVGQYNDAEWMRHYIIESICETSIKSSNAFHNNSSQSQAIHLVAKQVVDNIKNMNNDIKNNINKLELMLANDIDNSTKEVIMSLYYYHIYMAGIQEKVIPLFSAIL